MIFAVAGTQLPFDRMVKSLDDWAARNPDTEVIVQTGECNVSTSAIKAVNFIDPVTFGHYQSRAEVIVGHCGMGTILSALELKKPLIVMPRLSELGEHRNDHQLATAAHFKDRPGVYVASDERELFEFLDQKSALRCDESALPAFASAELLAAVETFIEHS